MTHAMAWSTEARGTAVATKNGESRRIPSKQVTKWYFVEKEKEYRDIIKARQESVHRLSDCPVLPV